jgi:hypothetical protein
MHEHHGIRRAAVDERERDRRVAGMRDTTLPFDEQDAVARADAAIAFEYELF